MKVGGDPQHGPRWIGLGFVIISWPYFAWYTFKIMTGPAWYCLPCGYVAKSEEDMLDHIRVCEKHPMREEINRVEKERDEWRKSATEWASGF